MSSSRITHDHGDTIYAAGDAAVCAFLIVDGTVEISILQGENWVAVARLGEGEMFGEMELIDGGKRRLTAIAAAPCELEIIAPAQITERLARTDPVLRALLHRQLARFRVALDLLESGVASYADLTPSAGSGEREAIARLRLEAQLRDAITADLLEVLWQPIGTIENGRIVGYEALMRWPHPELGDLLPDQFIALAEETSLIVALGDYALKQVCTALRALADRGCAPMPYIALNVSGRALSSAKFVDRIVAAAAAYGVDPAWMRLEVTESVLLDYHQVDELIQRCHAVNIRVAVDDFGTGYSSLGHLHQLGFDTIKLEQSFIRQMDQPRCLAIVRAIISVARAVGGDIVAEGVETEAQLAQLRELGCDYAQGYLVGKPLSLDELLSRAA